MFRFQFLLFTSFLGGLSFVSGATAEPSVEAPAKPSKMMMNGIQLSQYADFEKKWKLVTVRFRRDTKELRFTYANSVAWSHLKNQSPLGKSPSSGAVSYPAGSVFAKVGIATQDDSSFPSSAVPSGVRRTQFMVRNSKKYANTDGWGYALFDAEGKTFPGDLETASQACAACHRLVPDRGFVFSQPMTGLVSHRLIGGHLLGDQFSSLKYADVDVASLPKELQLQMPIKTTKVRSLVGELAKFVFPGTLDEVRPALTREAVRSGLPAILISSNAAGKNLYSLVFSTRDQGHCEAGQIEFLGVVKSEVDNLTARTIRFCESSKEK